MRRARGGREKPQEKGQERRRSRWTKGDSGLGHQRGPCGSLTHLLRSRCLSSPDHIGVALQFVEPPGVRGGIMTLPYGHIIVGH